MLKKENRYNIGDLLIPLEFTEGHMQLFLPFARPNPAIIIGRERYISEDPSDCQSNFPEDIRWLVYENGNIMYCTELLLDKAYERR